MRKERRMYNPKLSKDINLVVGYICPILVILYCTYFIIIGQSIYAIAQIPFTSNYVHSYSMILFAIAFILYQRQMKHIPVVARTVVTFLIVAIHSYFGGFLWDFNNLAVNGVWNIMFLMDLTVLVWFYWIILILNKHYLILKKKLSTSDKLRTMGLLFLQGFGYLALWYNGFWTHFGAIGYYNYDPNANVYWLFMRTTTFFLFYYLIEKGTEENYNVEPPRF
jgi:hypothetical protein